MLGFGLGAGTTRSAGRISRGRVAPRAVPRRGPPVRVQMLVGRKVLNEMGEKRDRTDQVSDVDVAGTLESKLKELYVDYLDAEGERVDYEALGKSAEFAEYERDTGVLIDLDPTQLKREERIAFFLNIYNALIIHAIVRLRPQTNLASRLLLYATACYNIGGPVYTLNDIEHNVLRGNKSQPLDPLQLLKFSPNDPRSKSIIDPPDPRIHFGLNCGAISCPPIRFYTAENLDYGLGISTSNFIDNDDNVRVDKESRVVHLSKLFQWYREDFAPGGSDASLLQWVADNAYGDTKKAMALVDLIDSKKRVRIEWLPYDWSLNDL